MDVGWIKQISNQLSIFFEDFRVKTRIALIALALSTWCGTVVVADIIYVMGSGHQGITSAISNLNALGHSVVNSDDALSDYSAYDQVWDLRYSTAMTLPERMAISNYMNSGGDVYISGENSGFDNRNNSINVLLGEIGAGQVGLVGNTGEYWIQDFTFEGQIVNSPNPLDDLTILIGRTVTAPSAGFLVTEAAASPGTGTTVGWDFGSLPSSPDARMLVGFDVETFQFGGVAWTENVVTYLGASSVPEPGSAALTLLALTGFALNRRRRPLP
jgi:hypothetical protein